MLWRSVAGWADLILQWAAENGLMGLLADGASGAPGVLLAQLKAKCIFCWTCGNCKDRNLDSWCVLGLTAELIIGQVPFWEKPFGGFFHLHSPRPFGPSL